MGTRILVTGGAGFVGSTYTRMLLGPEGPDGVEITVLDKLTYAGNPENLAGLSSDPRFTFVRGDVCDARLVASLADRHDEIVHFAAESHVDRSTRSGTPFVTTNVLGTQILLEAAVRHGIATFVHVSTDEVYGSVDLGAWTEEAPLAPTTPYSASKASADHLALAHHRTHGLDVRISRCANNYGPRQFPEKIVPLFITRLLKGLTVPLYGDGSQVREWLHVDDHCRGVELIRTRGRAGRVYNLGSGVELTNKELTALLLEACEAPAERVRHVEDRKGHDSRYSVDWSRAHDEVGYLPRRDLRQGLAETVDWYRKNEAWWKRPEQ
ncbi:dTDP-glucose 4,6-dehydratase [Streptomyces sp. NPDC020472]|uniref:dTDP-glucose 4,6-dehydratase n=1 Tax=Streptomyces sp. NPDC020472 TaxID=3365075 RepID=UPI003791BFF8